MLSLLPFLITLLYYLCFAFLLGLVGIIATAPRNSTARKMPWLPVFPTPVRRNGRAERRAFFLLALSLLLWQLTLFWEARTTLPALQLGLGRINFASIAVTVFLAWRFVQRVAQSGRGKEVIVSGTSSPAWSRWLRHSLCIETILLTLVTLLTPLVDEAESVVDGHPVTRFGPLFPFYLIHVLGYLGATLTLAFWARYGATSRAARGRLTLIAMGIVATGGVSLITNVLLPYGFGDFRFCDAGTLSTLVFLLTIAYAVFFHGLFDVRIMVRATLVYGLLLTLVLGGYSSAVFVASQYMTGAAGAGRLTQFVVLLIAFSFDPLRRFLEEKTDALLFGTETKTTQKKRQSYGTKIRLASLFPWRRD